MANVPNVPLARLRPPPLRDDWRAILRKAWSIRLDLAASVLSGIDVLCSVFITNPPFDRLWFGLIAAFFSLAAVLARLLAQKNMRTMA